VAIRVLLVRACVVLKPQHGRGSSSVAAVSHKYHPTIRPWSLHPPALQLCLGWVLPVWVAALSEAGARARFASQHVAHLHPSEKEWAARAAVGYEWLSLAYQLPCMCLITWHLLVAAAVVARWQSGAGGAGS
jgi:hypothetical protein